MGMAAHCRVDGTHRCLISDLRMGWSHCCPSLHHTAVSLTCSGRQMELKKSVNIFLQLRKVKGFASLVQETRGIHPSCQHSGNQRVLRSSEKQMPSPEGGWTKPRKQAGAVPRAQTPLQPGRCPGGMRASQLPTRRAVLFTSSGEHRIESTSLAYRKNSFSPWLLRVESRSQCCHNRLQTMAGGSWAMHCLLPKGPCYCSKLS